jgi:6-pyruvoyltetrahydropterin/6-carboxytetrahydropterin synthase
MQVFYERAFDAAHFLPSYEGKCQFMHGHTWNVQITINATQKGAMLIDFNELKNIIDSYDHRILNKNPFDDKTFEGTQVNSIVNNYFDTNPFKWGTFDYPSAENIAQDILEKVEAVMEESGYVVFDVEISVWESDHSCATVTRNEV